MLDVNAAGAIAVSCPRAETGHWRRTMKRGLMLGLLVAIGSVMMVAAQQPPANAPKVVDVEKINDSLYVLRGNGGGGNTAVLVMANGVAVVDAKNPGWGQPILAKIKELTPKP